MTCIAAVTDGVSVWIGGDAAGVSQESMEVSIRSDKKVFTKESHGVVWGFGFTGSYRMGQIIRYDLVLPRISRNDTKDLERFMVKKFIPALRKYLTAGGVASNENGVETCGTFIVGLLGKIFTVENDFQVGSPEEPIYAVGSGASFALGALHVIERFRSGGGTMDREAQVLEALAASECYSAGVRKPFTIVVATPPKPVS
jgi:hypothetical protein